LGGVENIDFVVCQICGSILYDSLSNKHLQKTHSTTKKEYLIRFPGATVCPPTKGLRVMGKNNPGYQHGGKFSPWSEKSIIHTKERRQEAKDKAVQNRTVMSQSLYWERRGYTPEEATKEISKIQTTFSLDICISKFGVEEGTKRWKERQEKWQANLNSKPFEERALINKKKVRVSGPKSTIEIKLFNELQKHIPALESQFSLERRDTPNKMFVYDIQYKNKIIEFQGIFWHAKHTKFLPEQIIFKQRGRPLRAKDIWEKDSKKASLAAERGFDLLVVWEDEYLNTPQETITKCLNFLNS